MSSILTSFYDIKLYVDIAKKIGNNIKQARKEKGYTQKEVATMLRMTQQQYSRFENGIFELNYEQLLTLCKIYDVTPNEIFTID